MTIRSEGEVQCITRVARVKSKFGVGRVQGTTAPPVDKCALGARADSGRLAINLFRVAGIGGFGLYPRKQARMHASFGVTGSATVPFRTNRAPRPRTLRSRRLAKAD